MVYVANNVYRNEDCNDLFKNSRPDFLIVPVVHPAYKSVPVPNSLCHLCFIPEPVNSFLFAFMRGNRFVTTIFAEL